MNLGRQQQDKRKKWMWCCGQRFGQKQVDHNLKVAVPMTTCFVMAAETGSQYFDWNPGFDDRIIIVENIFTSTLTKS